MTNANTMFSLANKTAVVTGTSAGLGVRLARTLLLAGARVAAIARRPTALDEEAMSTGRLLSISADLAGSLAGRRLPATNTRKRFRRA